jgi:hypothetical protein
MTEPTTTNSIDLDEGERLFTAYRETRDWGVLLWNEWIAANGAALIERCRTAEKVVDDYKRINRSLEKTANSLAHSLRLAEDALTQQAFLMQGYIDELATDTKEDSPIQKIYALVPLELRAKGDLASTTPPAGATGLYIVRSTGGIEVVFLGGVGLIQQQVEEVMETIAALREPTS